MRKKVNVRCRFHILNGVHFHTNLFFCTHSVVEGKILIARRISTVHDVRMGFWSSIIIDYYENDVNFSKSIFEFVHKRMYVSIISTR